MDTNNSKLDEPVGFEGMTDKLRLEFEPLPDDLRQAYGEIARNFVKHKLGTESPKLSEEGYRCELGVATRQALQLALAHATQASPSSDDDDDPVANWERECAAETVKYFETEHDEVVADAERRAAADPRSTRPFGGGEAYDRAMAREALGCCNIADQDQWGAEAIAAFLPIAKEARGGKDDDPSLDNHIDCLARTFVWRFIKAKKNNTTMEPLDNVVPPQPAEASRKPVKPTSLELRLDRDGRPSGRPDKLDSRDVVSPEPSACRCGRGRRAVSGLRPSPIHADGAIARCLHQLPCETGVGKQAVLDAIPRILQRRRARRCAPDGQSVFGFRVRKHHRRIACLHSDRR